MRPFKPAAKGDKDLPKQKMARPFQLPPLTPSKAESSSTRPALNSKNFFTVLADYPNLPNSSQQKPQRPNYPPLPQSLNLRPTVSLEASSSRQTKAAYTMKAPETFAQAVNPELTKTISSKLNQKEEFFDFQVSQILPLMALGKEVSNMDVDLLIKPCYTDFNYVDTDNPLKTRRYFEAILVDTESVDIEHCKDADNQIMYSRITIKRILEPTEWFADHLHTPIALTMTHRPQTYNWYDYKAAWMNFLYVRPRHTWFIKYSTPLTKAIIPRWFYEWWNLFGGTKEILPQRFSARYAEFQTQEEITTLPEHIKICKYYIKKRISYIITWNFVKSEIDRINYLCKQIQVKGWVPKQQGNSAVQNTEKVQTSQKKLSKAALKQKLKEAMDNIEDHSEEQIFKLLKDAASSEGEDDDNGYMCNPKGLALAYMDPDYE